MRGYEQEPGLFAVSRFDPETNAEYLIAFNTSDQPITRNIVVETSTTSFTPLAGSCPAAPTAPGSAAIELPVFGYAICKGMPTK